MGFIPTSIVKRLLELVHSLKKYKEHIHKIKVWQIWEKCPKCGSKAIIGWGTYCRKCISWSGIELVPIRRFQCKYCKKTFSYLPPFLIRYKRIYLPIIARGLINIVVKGTAYLKAVDVELKYEASTLYRYTKYFLDQAEAIYERIKQIIMSLNPKIEYEKSFPVQNEEHRQSNSRNLLAQAIKLWEFLVQIQKNRLPEIAELDIFTGLMYLQTQNT
ncbi:DUF6431 domain-containing protein [Candidatus Margulisiibacteriota bacterium]